MAKSEHLDVLRQGIKTWNEWRSHHHGYPSLRGAKLYRANLAHGDFKSADLRGANLRGANLEYSNLTHADLSDADLRGAKLMEATLFNTHLPNANLENATLLRTFLYRGDLRGANMRQAYLHQANLSYADLTGANFDAARMDNTVLGGSNLGGAKGLESCVHEGPSSIDLSTLQLSGNLPINFLRGCGLSNLFIDYIPSLLGNPFEFYSCFISYSHVDKVFARRLHDALQGQGIRCWRDEKQLLPGHDIYEEVDRGIRLWDKILLCCSKASLQSWWVDNEIGKAFAKEQLLMKARGQKVLALIPIDLDGHLFKWRDGKADEVRRRYAADFTKWQKDDGAFEREVGKVIGALRSDDREREQPPESKL
jgi:TIR domain/Pentapeptide repeats (8 copies)